MGPGLKYKPNPQRNTLQPPKWQGGASKMPLCPPRTILPDQTQNEGRQMPASLSVVHNSWQVDL